MDADVQVSPVTVVHGMVERKGSRMEGQRDTIKGKEMNPRMEDN